MATHDPAMYGACRAGVHPHGQVRPEVLYQRQRASPDRLNNSARRTYDLLRSTLVNTGRSMLLVESELTDALSASRNTVRTVLQQLAREGLVVREPKNGTRGTEALLLPSTNWHRWRPVGWSADRWGARRSSETASAFPRGGRC